MSQVTCRYCKKKIDKNDAFKVPHGKVFWYYCPEHASVVNEQDALFERLNDIFGYQVTDNTALYGLINPLISEHGTKKINHYFQTQKNWLVKTMSKEFGSEFGKIKYFIAILRNNLPNYNYKEDVVAQKEQQLAEVVQTNKFKKNKRVGLEALL